MQQTIQIIIGMFVLLLGIPVGNMLARFTKEELNIGQFWFKLIICISLVGSVFALILRKDALLFGFLFITVVTSRSLKNGKRKKKRNL